MPVGNGSRPRPLLKFKVTTSPAPTCPAPTLMGYTTSDTTPALSTWEPTMTREHLPWLPFGDGGGRKAVGFIRTQKRFRSLPTAGEATVGGCGCGSWNCRSSPITQDYVFRCVTFLQAPANGIRSVS